jgi:hypothetical protein
MCVVKTLKGTIRQDKIENWFSDNSFLQERKKKKKGENIYYFM